MGTLTYMVASTIDGYIAGPDGQHDFFPFDGEHMPALFEEYPETIPGHVRQRLGLPTAQKHFDTVLMGRRTYEPALGLGIEAPYAPLRTFVFSGAGIRVLDGEFRPQNLVLRHHRVFQSGVMFLTYDVVR